MTDRCYCKAHEKNGHPVDDLVTLEREMAVESPYGLETIRAVFLVLQHAGLRVVRESEAREREAIFAAHLDSCGKRILELECALATLDVERLTDALTVMPQTHWDPCMATSIDEVSAAIARAYADPTETWTAITMHTESWKPSSFLEVANSECRDCGNPVHCRACRLDAIAATERVDAAIAGESQSDWITPSGPLDKDPYP